MRSRGPISAWCSHAGDLLLSGLFAKVLPLVLITIGAVVPARSQSIGCIPNTANYPCVYVANNRTSSISVINASTNTLITNILVGKFPVDLAVTPDNSRVYLANQTSISVISTSTNTLIATISGLSASPSQIAITPDGLFAYIAEPGFNVTLPFIEIIDTRSNQIVSSLSSPSVTNPTAIAFTPDGKKAFVADTCTDQNQNLVACADVIDITSQPPRVTNTILVPGTLGFQNASIAITLDGSMACMSVASPNHQLEVAFMPTNGSPNFPVGAIQNSAIASNYGFAITPTGILYAAAPLDAISGNPLNSVIPVDTNLQTLVTTIPVGNAPTGVAVNASGSTVYVTNAIDDTVSVIDTATNTVVATVGVGSNPQGIAAMPAVPPSITIQPSSQTIFAGQPVALSVTATGTPPFSYQWFQGQSGNTSAPIRGATASTYTTVTLTTTTNYWVMVSNVAGGVNSKTATVTVAPGQPPSCTLSVQPTGVSSPFTVMASATCTDPQLQSLTTSIDWGDQSQPASTSGGSLTAMHTYVPTANPAIYTIIATATDTSGLPGIALSTVDLTPVPQQPVFAGQTAVVSVSVPPPAKGSVNVLFECINVTDATGKTQSASALGITCDSIPSPITFVGAPRNVTIEIHSSGPASAALFIHSRMSFALWLYLPFQVGWIGVRSTPRLRRGSKARHRSLPVVILLCFLATSCGGGFTPPIVTQTATPPGSYQVNVIGVLARDQGAVPGFSQLSLIVPLKVDGLP